MLDIYTWEARQKQLAHHMENEPMEEFLRWSTMQAAFFIGTNATSKSELADLEPRMLDVIKDPNIGSPSIHKGTSGTYIRQAYALQQWETKTGYSVNDQKYIFEFGGGYGVMPIVCHRLEFDGYYEIFDLPIVSTIQKWYLNQVGIIKDVDLVNTIEFSTHDLFISLCGLSEAPILTREAILNSNPSTHYLILFQHTWGEINNLKWFTSWFSENHIDATIEQSIHDGEQYYIIC